MSKQEMPLRAVADHLGITKTKLHYYRNLKLIKPSQVFKSSKNHLYDLTAVKEALAQVTKLQKKGLTLIEIADVINGRD
jgi:DNA-binding transcriptional MerR regulator